MSENQCKLPASKKHYLPMGTPWLGGECPLCVREERNKLLEIAKRLYAHVHRFHPYMEEECYIVEDMKDFETFCKENGVGLDV